MIVLRAKAYFMGTNKEDNVKNVLKKQKRHSDG